jgi:hypothetical protein
MGSNLLLERKTTSALRFDYGAMIDIEIGKVYDLLMPYSEVCMASRIAGTIQTVKVCENGVYLINSDGSNERRIYVGNNPRGPKWSPDGQFVVFTQITGETTCYDVGFICLADPPPPQFNAPQVTRPKRTLARVDNKNANGEYYITDTFGLLRDEGRTVAVVDAVPASDVLSVNTPAQLAEVAAILESRTAAGARA